MTWSDGIYQVIIQGCMDIYWQGLLVAGCHLPATGYPAKPRYIALGPCGTTVFNVGYGDVWPITNGKLVTQPPHYFLCLFGTALRYTFRVHKRRAASDSHRGSAVYCMYVCKYISMHCTFRISQLPLSNIIISLSTEI